MLEMKDLAGRHEGEQVEMFVRSCYLYLLWRLLPPALLFVTAVVLGVALLVLFPTVSGGLIFLGLWLVFLPALWLAWRFALWYYDYFIITDQRVIDFVSKPFLSETRNETHLSRIQDARVVFPNFLAVTLDFGHVIVQTAGITGELSFRYAARPNQLQARLMELVAKHQGPRAATGALNQLVEALRTSLDAQQPGATTISSPPAPELAPKQPSSSQGQSRTFHDIVLVRSAAEGNPKTWRKHWLILLKTIFRPVIGLAFASVLLVLIPIPIVGMIAIAALLFGGIYIAWQTVDWYNDVYIITDDRIIDVEKVPFISEDRRESQLVMIQDVNYSQPNFVARLFNLGDVIVQTAGRAGVFTFNNVPNPSEVQREIVQRWEQARLAQRAAPLGPEAAQDFIELLDRYHETKHKEKP
jgi:uncharacterized membrane protein YdbT with pleckstrin-like domain